MTTILSPQPPKIEDIENYHPNGKLKEKGMLVNGKEEGFWDTWYENGKKMGGEEGGVEDKRSKGKTEGRVRK